MNKHLKNIINGMTNLWPMPREYQHPTGGGFAQDAKKIRSDFSRLSGDIGKILKHKE